MNFILKTQNLLLEIAPGIGGSIVRFDYIGKDRRQSVLRPASADVADVLGMASFPLVPFANRIRGGAFDCDGATVRLSPNMAGDPSPLHGQGWLHAWTVDDAAESSARLSFVHDAGEWPWRYEAWQEFNLDATGLDLTLGCRNLSDRRMPCGLAQHPYFPCDGQTLLDVDVASAWAVDTLTLPVERVAAEGRFELRQRRICGANLDNAFDGWSGSARFFWPGQPMRATMSSPDATRFHVYSPREGGFIAAEPVQNAVTALNAPQDDWDRLGIALLDHGEARELHVRFELEPV